MKKQQANKTKTKKQWNFSIFSDWLRSPQRVPLSAGRVDRKFLIKLTQNENPYGMSPSAASAICTAIQKASLYPPIEYQQIRATIAAHHGVSYPNLTVTNGADEAILLTSLAMLESNQTVITTRSTFLAYRAGADAAKATNHEVAIRDFQVPAQDIIQAMRIHQPKVVFICNPHNPTGTVLGHREVSAIVGEASVSLPTIPASR